MFYTSSFSLSFQTSRLPRVKASLRTWNNSLWELWTLLNWGWIVWLGESIGFSWACVRWTEFTDSPLVPWRRHPPLRRRRTRPRRCRRRPSRRWCAWARSSTGTWASTSTPRRKTRSFCCGNAPCFSLNYAPVRGGRTWTPQPRPFLKIWSWAWRGNTRSTGRRWDIFVVKLFLIFASVGLICIMLKPSFIAVFHSVKKVSV